MRGERMLQRGRKLANARMSETVEIGVYADATDPVTGDPIRSLVTERYVGPGRIKYESLTVSVGQSAGEPVAVQRPLLSVPSGSPSIPEGDEVHVIASSVDGSLVGRRYRVAGAPQAGQTTSHRVPLEELG